MDGHTNAVISLVVANRLMYTGSADCTARCWVTEFGDNTRSYKGHKHSVICMKFDQGVCTSLDFLTTKSFSCFETQAALHWH